jgi:predicted peptidase
MTLRGWLLLAGALPLAAQIIDPHPPTSDERAALVERLRKESEAVTGRFEGLTFEGSDGHAMPYRLFRPAKVVPGRRYPLVIYLHGSGGTGTDNRRQYLGGNLLGSHVWAVDRNQAKHPAFVLVPQSDQGWAVQPETPIAPGVALLFELLSKVTGELPVDGKRIYVTGQSMGGYGTWYVGMYRPEMFAAMVPVCGGGAPSWAAKLGKVPLWNFHGTADQTVPVTRSREMLEALRKAGGKPLSTEYPGVGHNSWELAYSEPALVDWLFAQHR